MAFRANWNGFGFNTAGLSITGDTSSYRVNWGDGSAGFVRLDEDDDGDPLSGSTFHNYSQDGTYDVAVFQAGAGLPPVRLKAFLYSNATGDLDLGGSYLSDVMTGGSGHDSFRGAGGNDALAGADGNDRLFGGNGDDFAAGGRGQDVLSGGDGNDLLGGNEDTDTLHGEGGDDTLFGDTGNDRLFGDDGDDFLEGGMGVDRLTGGAGADVFEIAPPRDADNQQVFTDPDRDVILDYVQGTDHLSVDQWLGTEFEFLGTGRFTGAGDELRYQQVGGATIVFGDVDGDRQADFSVRIEGSVALTSADFVL
jgi:Ca2+-binding RTX toxin-like protein